MENYAEAIVMMEESDIGSDDVAASSSLLRLLDFLTVAFRVRLRRFDRVLFFIKAVVEYSFGMYIGAIAGGLLGRYAGNVYVTHFEPVYLYDFNELQQWGLIPYEFAGNGAVIGVVAGVIAVAIINSILLSQRIVSLYQKGITEPRDIAQAFGKSARLIGRKINRLAKKGKITCQKHAFQKEPALI
jgi:hypothetical protein